MMTTRSAPVHAIYARAFTGNPNMCPRRTSLDAYAVRSTDIEYKPLVPSLPLSVLSTVVVDPSRIENVCQQTGAGGATSAKGWQLQESEEKGERGGEGGRGGGSEPMLGKRMHPHPAPRPADSPHPHPPSQRLRDNTFAGHTILLQELQQRTQQLAQQWVQQWTHAAMPSSMQRVHTGSQGLSYH